MADFKDEISPAMAARLASELERAWPAFPTGSFLAGLDAQLAPRALLARVDVVADRLAASLPTDFAEAASVMWRALESESLTGWMTLPCGYWVARAGADEPALALALLAGLTPRWSSEGPIRVFIERHPEITYEHLRRWATDPDEHVRRLVSEGTRPRLPWAPQLRGLRADPGPNLGLLDRLVDDPSAYVRRSVANHLNDISKDHPDLALELAGRWLGRGPGAAWAVRHGLRSLVKAGDRRALALMGVSVDADIALVWLEAPSEVVIGQAVTFTFTLVVEGGAPADAVIDYRVHYAGASGARRPKVFKLTRRRLVPGQPETIVRRHRFEHVSVRRIWPGPHRIDVQVNGRVLGAVDIEVVDGTSPGGPRPSPRPSPGAGPG